jgi:hypothetical protein
MPLLEEKARNFAARSRPAGIVSAKRGFYNRTYQKLQQAETEGIMTALLENKELVAMTIILLALSILCRFVTGIFLNSLIRESENMSTTQNRLLKQCKVKFRNCYKLNDGVPNIPVFVDKFMGKIRVGRFSLDGLSHLSGQLMLLSILAAGIGACLGIINGKGLGEILPYYLISFLGLYLYFSISGLVDLEGKKELLKVSLTDYLENHMAARLSVLEESELAAEGRSSKSAEKTEAHAGRKTSRRAKMQADETEGGRKEGAQGQEQAAAQAVMAQASSQTAAGGEAMVQKGMMSQTKSAAEKRMEEQVFTKNQEKELEELLKEFFA